jgi:predicted DNA-binding protein with PD1-like motif
MQWRVLNEHGGLRTIVLVLATDDEAMATLTSFAKAQRLRAAQFTAIGACSRVVIAWFDWTTKQYRKIAIDEQVEVLSLAGDVTLDDETPKVHGHMVVGKSDATAHGGHLVEAHVRPTLEIVLTETPAYLRRRFDPASGLALIDAKQ